MAASLTEQLLTYYRVLSHWNRKMNLTSLAEPAEAVDRMLLEPVAAAPHLPHGIDLIDLGSGGGSPAIPLALALSARRLVMVESRLRKAAFLREVLRELGLSGTVEAARFEEVATRPAFGGSFGVVSIRAVRLEETTVGAISALLEPKGHAALFGSTPVSGPIEHVPSSLIRRATIPLIPASRSFLTILRKA